MMPNPHEMGRGRNEDRLREAEAHRLAKQTRKGKVSASRRGMMVVSAALVGLVKVIGGR